MNKKGFLVAAVLLLVLGVLGYFTLNLDSTKRPAATVTEISPDAGLDSSKNVPAVPSASAGSNRTSPNNLAAPAVAPDPLAAAMPISSLPPSTVLDQARMVMKNYGTTFGENPVGTNPEITEALLGKNPKGINFIAVDSGLRVNEQGEMVDAYGTPFFFHQISGKQMEIRSAGEDRKLWTFDDLVTR